jgi:hypothetical protein
MSTETITWHTIGDRLPDDDETVLIRSPRMDPPIWFGYASAGEWLTTDGDIVRDVTHWAGFPEGPAAAKGDMARVYVRDEAEFSENFERVETVRGSHIKRTMRHDAGAFARCHYCGRYSDKIEALNKDEWPCECGKRHGWSGSFVAPTVESKWSDVTPNAEVRGDAPLYGAASLSTDGLCSTVEAEK